MHEGKDKESVKRQSAELRRTFAGFRRTPPGRLHPVVRRISRHLLCFCKSNFAEGAAFTLRGFSLELPRFWALKGIQRTDVPSVRQSLE